MPRFQVQAYIRGIPLLHFKFYIYDFTFFLASPLFTSSAKKQRPFLPERPFNNFLQESYELPTQLVMCSAISSGSSSCVS